MKKGGARWRNRTFASLQAMFRDFCWFVCRSIPQQSRISLVLLWKQTSKSISPKTFFLFNISIMKFRRIVFVTNFRFSFYSFLFCHTKRSLNLEFCNPRRISIFTLFEHKGIQQTESRATLIAAWSVSGFGDHQSLATRRAVNWDRTWRRGFPKSRGHMVQHCRK